jgi:ubiquinone/menaquinone biosynthesis C-methylase UbiE
MTTAAHASIMELLPTEVVEGYAGCASPIPLDYTEFAGLNILDLSCGRGADAFILSYYAGPTGRVYGVDMTDEQLATARAAAPVVAERFGFPEPTTSFHQGYIETCDDIPDGSIDLVVSNCVINLTPFKAQVFATINRVLKEGGEWYIADIVSDRRMPSSVRNDADLVAECLGGAAYAEDLRRVCAGAGFPYLWEVDRKPVPSETVEQGLGEKIGFWSVVWRAVKLTQTETIDGQEWPPLERTCEDYGQHATYLGTIGTAPAAFALDADHLFETDRPVAVCRNTANILRFGRLAEHFEVTAPRKHFGLFECAPAPSAPEDGSGLGACC